MAGRTEGTGQGMIMTGTNQTGLGPVMIEAGGHNMSRMAGGNILSNTIMEAQHSSSFCNHSFILIPSHTEVKVRDIMTIITTGTEVHLGINGGKTGIIGIAGDVDSQGDYLDEWQ